MERYLSLEDKEKRDKQTLPKAPTSGQYATRSPCSETSLEERQQRGSSQIVHDENQLTHQGNSVEDNQRTLGSRLTESVGNQLSPQHNCSSKSGNHLPLQQSAKGHNQLTEGNHEPEVYQGARPKSIQTKHPVGTGCRRSRNANSNTRPLRSTLFSCFLLLSRIFFPDQNSPNLRSHPSTFPLVSGATAWDESSQPGIDAVSPPSLPLKNENLKLSTKEVTGNYEGLSLERVRTDGKGDTRVSSSGSSSGSCGVKPTEMIQATRSDFSDGNAEHDKGTVRRGDEHDQRKEERLEPGSDSSPSFGNQPPLQQNLSKPSQLTEGSCKPDEASNFKRKWERQGARPKLNQSPVVLPLWLSSSPVSEGLAEDSLPGKTDVSSVGNGMSSDGVNTSNCLLPPDDFGTSDHSLTGEQDFRNAVKANDNPLTDSEQGTAEPEQLMSELERKDQLIGEKEEEKRQQLQQEDVSKGSQRLCKHYERRCRVRFSCCTVFYPCHRCHNKLTSRKHRKAKLRDATHIKCSLCQLEQEIDQSSEVCHGCGEKMAAYFCFTCKHFKSSGNNPYHCDQCGICRHNKDEKSHCEVCNVRLDKTLEIKHTCEPDWDRDKCFICQEDIFSDFQTLPCSHKVHSPCADAMKQNRVRTCPGCRDPLDEWLETEE